MTENRNTVHLFSVEFIYALQSVDGAF